MGRKGLRVKFSSRKFLPAYGKSFSQSLIRGVLHLAGWVCLIGPASGPGVPAARGKGAWAWAQRAAQPSQSLSGSRRWRDTFLWLPQACTLFPDILSQPNYTLKQQFLKFRLDSGEIKNKQNQSKPKKAYMMNFTQNLMKQLFFILGLCPALSSFFFFWH